MIRKLWAKFFILLSKNYIGWESDPLRVKNVSKDRRLDALSQSALNHIGSAIISQQRSLELKFKLGVRKMVGGNRVPLVKIKQLV